MMFKNKNKFKLKIVKNCYIFDLNNGIKDKIFFSPKN